MNGLCQIYAEISFIRQGLRNASNNKHLGSDLPAHGYITFILEEKITKVEQRAIETLIDNFLVKRRAFYRLNERFVSNITGDLSFFQRGSSDDTSQTT